MIILAREKPKKLEVLEAILRRLPDNDPNYDYYNDIYFRTKSGYDGEQKVDKEWSQINTHKSHYLLHNLELQNHQIDTLYICCILQDKNAENCNEKYRVLPPNIFTVFSTTHWLNGSSVPYKK
ncbi:hypothetical protein [Lysinibacillus telephonicus]|uniref:hypothetical protein n=1 Tax=Lysinibacillus telephonicus TaxID=1714840 RepID=UPI003BA0C9AB